MKKYKYKLEDSVIIQVDILGQTAIHPYFSLDTIGKLTINKNFAWDGMTMYPDDTTTYLASLYHDCLYQMIELNILEYKYKSVADKLLYTTLIRDGHPKIKALIVYIGVSLFGRYFIY